MALESTSPFGAADGSLSKGRTLFSDNNDTGEPFPFPFNASGTLASVYNSTSLSNAVLNVSHSTPKDGKKIDLKTSMSDFQEKINTSNVVSTMSENEVNSKNNGDTSKSDTSGTSAQSESSGVSDSIIKFPDLSGNNHTDEIDDEFSDNEDLVECGNCDNEFQTLQEYMDHTCAGSKSIEGVEATRNESKELSDVESFDGKIVYNPDGSAYIIEGDSDSELDSIIDLPQKEGAIIDKKGRNDNEPSVKEIPQIDNAFFVPRNPNSFMSSPFMLPHKSQSTPIMHSYRVYDLRSGKHKSANSGDSSEDRRNSSSPSSTPESSTSAISLSTPSSSLTFSLKSSQIPSVPMKPILMCFICKLSFGFAKSFTSHATNEHLMDLTEEEKEIMSLKNSSAIIQGIGKDKAPLMSFLEPIKSSSVEMGTKKASESAEAKVGKSNTLKETTSVSYIYTKPKLSDSFNETNSQLSNQKQTKDLSIKDIRDQLGHFDKESASTAVLNALSTKTLHYDNKSDRNELDNKKIRMEADDSNSNSSSYPVNSVQRYIPEDYTTQSPKSFLPPYTSSQRQGFYGVCEEHPNGRAAGVECPSCDMILSSSQSLGGHMTMMHSRNSCKTLKCPKCNWHYKYQETLEIHMKEKHPEGDQKCMYCLTNQTHPRLARGESYSCGYKPYRCEVCNYSTTTKGNLSIHMQSDKHLNNVQDLANSGGDLQQFNKHNASNHAPPQLQQPHTPSHQSQTHAPTKTPPHQQLMQQQQHQQQSQQHPGTSHDSIKKVKPKPTWRCDVCNYETNVARNLRIHMTSEKHTHNMMVLQQNMKHMQRDMQIHQMNQLVMLQQDPSFMGLTGPIPGGITFPYDGSLMMGGLPAGFGGDAPVDLSKENGIGPGQPGFGSDALDINRLFQCCVCNIYGTDSLESLHQHLQLDRTKQHENENISVSSGTYMCNLCQYKTTLKANFQLHCKTDKHIQRLQLVNHIKEGGANNEWRLKYLNVSNPVQVRCNACDYYTNSIHKLQIHTGNPRHEASAQLFCHLQQQENMLSKPDKYYHCALCKFNARSKLGLMQHVHSVQHLHSESMKQIEMKETGQLEIDIGDIFMVKETEDKDSVKFDDETSPTANGLADEDSSLTDQDASDSRDRVTTPLSPSQAINNNNNTIKQTAEDLSQKGDARNQDKLYECPYCTYNSANEMHLKSHLASVHPNNLTSIACPLCQEPFAEKSKIQKHLTAVHNVNSEGLHKLLALVEEPKSKMPPTTFRETSLPTGNIALAKICEVNLDYLELESAKLAAEDAVDMAAQNDKDGDDQFRCQTCSKTFTNIDQLYSHQNELGHLELKQTPRGPGYLCWKKGCNQYFKTAQALQMHFREIHAKAIPMTSSDKSEYKFQCQICTLAFKSQSKLHFHAQMHILKSAVTCNLCTKSFQSIALLSKHVETAHDLGESELEQYRAEIYANTLAFATFMGDPKLAKVFSLSDLPKENFKHSDISTNPELEAKSLQDLSENGGVDSEENSPASTPVSVENGLEKGSNLDEFGENDLNSKEQQFFEDHINSKAFAEDSYDDPNRKYKCHRCRVAFTKQIYLTAHNKTLMHKKGYRMSYPMEKFLDPNRPYKCEICKESFTQKNILLVHYNSVSHLHKVKQQGAEGLLPMRTGSDSPLTSTPVTQSIHSPATTLSSPSPSAPLSSASGIPEKSSGKKSRESSPDDESQRPYKCNICKVSYSQGSTLDIHIRSVAHQTRASKLHELAMTGEVDLSRPLIEEPVDKSFQAQQQKLLNDFLKTSIPPLSQQSLLFQGLPGISSFPGFPGLPSMPGLPLLAAGLPPLLPLSLQNQVFPSSLPSSTSSHHSQSGSKEKSSSSTTSSAPSSTETKMSSSKSLEKISPQSVTTQSQKGVNAAKESSAAISAAVAMATATAQTSGMSGSIQVCQRCSAVFASQDSFIQHQALCPGSSSSPVPSPASGNKSRFVGRIKTAVQRNLLENFGFECVMQFNEFNQRRVKKEREDEVKENSVDNPKMEESAETDDKGNPGENPANEEAKEGKVVVKEEPKTVDLPEMNKSKCGHCSKQFSSVWVLKAHEEEVHKEFVPLEIVEEIGDQFKTDFEKKMPKDVPITDLPIPSPVSTPQLQMTEEKPVKSEMPPPPPPPPAQMQLDMLQMMNMFSMGMMPMPMPLLMNSQPSLMPMMMPPPGLDMKPPPSLPGLDPALASGSLAASQKRQLEQASMANQKRARTRINDEQLKVLRGYFDINNSPAEEQIQAMSEQTGLPMKVIKHWFRNTLFKERQRNKDSPYNFNNPPSTTLDLEEYEKTGKLTIIEDSSPPLSKSPSPAPKMESEIKKEVVDKFEESQKEVFSAQKSQGPKDLIPQPSPARSQVPEMKPKVVSEEKYRESKLPSVPATLPTRSETQSTLSSSSTPVPPTTMSPLLTSPGGSSSFMQNFVSNLPGMSTPNTQNYPPTSTTPNSLTHYDSSHNYSPPGSGSTGRRANRTRFTDYQIKCLQEYFEQNAYPKDDELEHLSKMLGLSPRVIVVWFQNARQKARKIYENQPADNMKDLSGSSPYARTTGLNYQCKKCQAVFQRYYDLIRHQKRSCFTEAEKQDSNFLSDDSDSMSNVTSLDNTAFSDSESECSNLGRSMKEVNSSGSSEGKKYQCEKCDQSFNHFDQYREHQSIHNLASGMFMNMPTGGAFGMLQSMANSQHHNMTDQSPNKRKYEDEDDDQDQPRDKRLRTTILPEQLDYLYQKYQVDCNPSRKQLEAISKDVGLKKRVVQVWFQNTRARERKGQYRAHQQLIHKRCPVCRALFRAKSALESHLATKHPDEMAKGEINIDSIPDAAIESPGPSSSVMPPSPDYNKLLAPPTMQGLLPYMPPASLGGLPGFPPMADPIQMSMKQFYEDSFKKYINELSSTSHASHKPTSYPHEFTSTPLKTETVVSSNEDDAPLDLSKPLKVSTHSEDKHKEGPTSQSSFSSGQSSSGGQGERSRQNSGHGPIHSVLGSAVDQAYMMNRFKRDSAMHTPELEEESSNMSSNPASPGHTASSVGSNSNKRYRTQMTSLQVRIMKHIFIDYKTPTMAECEMLGRVIGLQKRVVQVWFQNARAKEKKAKLNLKYPSSELDFPKPPEDCSLCNFKYSHKYTIQDHIFTKKHIDKVRDYIQSQTDAEREMSTTAASMAGVSGLIRSQQSNDVDHMRKLMEEANHQSQMAQLQSMGLAPLGLPPNAMAGMGLLPPDLLHSLQKEGSSTKEGKEVDSQSDGTEHLLGYDPMTYGTPLPLLQIPQQAIKDVSSKLMDPKATIGQYTQDCKSISSLKALVNNADYNCVREATVDVGYICKKCQMVYPAREACVAHQRLMCFPGGKIPEGVNIALKLEQIQYECKLCSEKVSTVQEFKTHCEVESHKTKMAVYQQQRQSGGLSTKPSAYSPRQSGSSFDSERASVIENNHPENA
ncbi:zinc finger homeobox protein 4-like isoform X2 [Mercenaria mercenaria]|uniref:zinc finger homeobox protein 4-like isoform X2 n=1 Tax=Mercenaria mercenaria TaxID=6596 RepID=UPI00234F25E3|nr:zinc finger homeobox protein 4-like isoform X2 [Mercenaria mercenaria]